MRLFIAIDLPILLRDWVAFRQKQLQAQWPQDRARLRWTTPDQLHLTLQFLGECPEARIAGILSAMKEAAEDFSAFRLSLSDLGTFGGPRMGVLWLGIATGTTELGDLTSRLRTALASRGYPIEKRPYHPHLTLARSRAKLSSKGVRSLPPALEPCPEVFVDGLHLFRSDLSSSGATYTRLHSVPLNSEN